MKASVLAPITNLTVVKSSQPVSTLDQSIQEMYDQITQRAYEMFAQRGYLDGFHLEDWLNAESELFSPAPVSIREDEDVYHARVDVPGFSAEQLEVKVEPNRVLIQGRSEQREEQKRGRIIYSESRQNDISRIVNLPGEVDPHKTTAFVKDGILSLTLPKTVATKAASVEVKAAAA